MRYLSKTNWFAWLLVSIPVVTIWPAAVFGQATEFYSQRTQRLAGDSFQAWQRVSAFHMNQLASMGNTPSRRIIDTRVRTAARQGAINAYLSQVVPAMQISKEVAHIPKEHPVPVPAKGTTEGRHLNWIRYYTRAKTGLRPNVKYQWKSNASKAAVEITLSEKHIKTIRDNFDVVMWYRQELGKEGPGREQPGAKDVRIFFDCIVADLLKGMPDSPKIDMRTGTLTVSDWELNERNLREQLVMAYRYFVAKYMTYDEYKEFAPADREALTSLMKIGYLMGCRMDEDWFDKKPVRLDRVTKETRWKKAVSNALAGLDLTTKKSDADYEQSGTTQNPDVPDPPCIIKIPPPKPPPKPKPAPPAPKPPVETKIEIIVRPK